jgi:hypothetical protein
MARYLVHPFDVDYAPPGSGARYRENNLREDFAAQRERDVKFNREYLLHGDRISVYVEDCRVFMQDIKKNVEQMLDKLNSDRKYVRLELDVDLARMKHKINQWMNDSRVQSALECLQNARPFTREERLQFPTATALYPRANVGHLLIKKAHFNLTQLPANASKKRVVQLLNDLMTALENWLPGRSWV